MSEAHGKLGDLTNENWILMGISLKYLCDMMISMGLESGVYPGNCVF
jgi:hypothetical protein